MPYSTKTPPGRAGLGVDCPFRRGENDPRNSTNQLRLQRLAEALHALGPKPLFHFLSELERGADMRTHLEQYATLPRDFIKANNGDCFAPAAYLVQEAGR
jgi:hypothetical protein